MAQTAPAPAKAAAPAPATNDVESKRSKFARLANARLMKAKSAIAMLANLANKAQYEFNTADHTTMMKILRDQIGVVDAAFTAALAGKAAPTAGEKFFE